MQPPRREFLKRFSLGIAAAARAAGQNRGEMPYRTLGHTGEKVSLLGLGGSHIGVQQDEAESIRIIRTAIDNGVTFLDNCWDYHDGQSEVRMGKALRDGYRQKVFLMTKIDGRERKAAARQIDESLERLQTDHIDLMQLHEVIRENDPDRAFAPGGAMEALSEARQAGKIRYIGFTGHKAPAIHLKMLRAAFAHKFQLDSVQMPLNLMDAHYDSFAAQVAPVALEHKIAVLGMKPMGGGVLLKSNAASPVDCLHYAMNLPVSVVISGCNSLPILQQALDAARSFQPLDKQQVAAMLAKTAPAAAGGKYELYKTSDRFDGTVHNPQWLG
jgi:predicted aldo/keto reductase-like oxidoreductase